MNKRFLSFGSVMALCLLLISGCGSSGNKEGDAAAVTAVGDRLCVQCHSAVTDSLTGETLMAQYEKSSPHKDSLYANAGNGCEACHGNASQHQGIGPIAYPNPYADSGARCAECHKGNYGGNFTTEFAASRHVVELAANPEDGNSCRRCHTHEGAVAGNIGGLTGIKEVLDNTANQGAVPYASKTTFAFQCSTCHEHGGGLRTVMARDTATGTASTGPLGNLVNWNPDKNQAPGQFDLCTSCHTLYNFNGSTLLASGTAAEATTGKPATDKVGHHETSWYRVIATTHYDNPATGLNATDAALAPGNVIEGYVLRTNTANPCFDCHGHEARTNTNAVADAAVTVKPNTIYTDWAQSGHAGGMLKAKIAAANAWPNHRVRNNAEGTYAVDSAMVSGVSAADSAPVDITATLKKATSAGDAWAHYQWERTLKADGTDDRGSCQKCHTATGASNYLAKPATYDYKNNNFAHLSGWTAASTGVATKPSPQQEVLYCWGCHSNSSAGLVRAPGAIKADYNFKGALAQFPDVGQSNVCISCHSGRESGESLDTITNFANASFKNSHYLAVGGLMYVKAGFTAFIDPNTVIGTSTYGKSLTSDADGGALSSTHRKLGTTAINGDSHNAAAFTPGNFDSNGPCVTCHMQATGQAKRSTSHTWEINWNAFNEVCIKCHDEEGGVPLTAANFSTLFIDEQAVPFQDALALALNTLLTKYNINYNQAVYPYFYDLNIGPAAAVKDWTRGGALSAADAKKLMGACFNINILKREPAAYVHARTYARRLLYDTIDFLDDKIINMSTGATAIAYNPVKYVKGPTANTGGTTESFKYLAGYNRTSNARNALERP